MKWISDNEEKMKQMMMKLDDYDEKMQVMERAVEMDVAKLAGVRDP